MEISATEEETGFCGNRRMQHVNLEEEGGKKVWKRRLKIREDKMKGNEEHQPSSSVVLLTCNCLGTVGKPFPRVSMKSLQQRASLSMSFVLADLLLCDPNH